MPQHVHKLRKKRAPIAANSSTEHTLLFDINAKRKIEKKQKKCRKKKYTHSLLK